MTREEAIAWVDEKKPNDFSREDKERWLAEAETMVSGIRGRYPGTPEPGLLLPLPLDRGYLRYLEAQIDYVNGEISGFNNAMALFYSCLEDYAAWCSRTLRRDAPRERFY